MTVVHSMDRIEGFEAAASQAFAPLRIRAEDGRSFRGEFGSMRVDELVLTRIQADPVTVKRERSVMSSTDPDLIKVAWHVSGRAGVDQGGRQCLLSPGDLVIYESGRPYELPFWESYDTMVVGIPAYLFGAHADQLRQRVAIPVPAERGTGALLTTMLQGVATGQGSDSVAGAQHHLATALVSLVCAAFIDALPEAEADPWERIQAFCLANLSDPGLSVESVASAHHISPRYLHKLCQARGFTLARWIRTERLSRIRRDLGDPLLTDRSTSAVAARWGVLDAGHLGRMLRAEFGETAREIRARSRA
ncbi:AraC-like ligand-binding domain-containing protein [Nocardiopsis valliformis]|uniref:AraC-like ligand-binding domain-containing protein n=1 Tax=Nocardiopsis valliformis TaxID=239974 RepID=UPI000348A276|nr:helix-turn-helix domain-containing protein [Nocardiopsis valliformis]